MKRNHREEPDGYSEPAEESVDERREFRHKRRVRNQIISYCVVAVFIILLLTGGVIGVRSLTKMITDKKQAEELARQLDEMAKEQEADIPIEPPVQEEEEPQVDPLEEIVNTCIAEMPLEDKVAGLFFVTPEALTGVDTVIQAGDGTKDALHNYAVGGLAYFAKNIKSREQLTEMLTNTVSMTKYPLFLGVDEEGGSVARVAESGIEVTKVEDMGTIGSSGDPAQARSAGDTIGAYLSGLGFNLDFAPVADVLTDPDNKTIGKRSFGSDPAVVGQMVPELVAGLQENGVSACVKHFPGLGDTVDDSHSGMASSERTLDDMRAAEFPAFKAGIDAGVRMVMVSHLSAPNAVGDNTPCSLSKTMITDILRGELGFQGIVITDAMNMAAITEYYTSDEAAVKAIEAGADMILMPEDFETACRGVLTAVSNGTIPEERIDESLRRIYRVKYADKAGQVTGEDAPEGQPADPAADSGQEAAEGEDATEGEDSLSGQ